MFASWRGARQFVADHRPVNGPVIDHDTAKCTTPRGSVASPVAASRRLPCRPRAPRPRSLARTRLPHATASGPDRSTPHQPGCTSAGQRTTRHPTAACPAAIRGPVVRCPVQPRPPIRCRSPGELEADGVAVTREARSTTARNGFFSVTVLMESAARLSAGRRSDSCCLTTNGLENVV
jgi:hypothetical protein